jgi:hypothetical protein
MAVSSSASSRQEWVVRTEATVRSLNEDIKRAHLAASTGAGEQVGFLCECGRLECDRLLVMTIGEYKAARADARQFAVARSHVQTDIEQVVARTDRYVVVATRQAIAAASPSRRTPAQPASSGPHPRR